MSTKITTEDVKHVLDEMVRSFDDELSELTESALENYWHFKWDETRSVEWNAYEFFELLGLYGRQCRRWEEMHHGHVCVVERVRDKYLMPKIKDFVSRVRKNEQ